MSVLLGAGGQTLFRGSRCPCCGSHIWGKKDICPKLLTANKGQDTQYRGKVKTAKRIWGRNYLGGELKPRESIERMEESRELMPAKALGRCLPCKHLVHLCTNKPLAPPSHSWLEMHWPWKRDMICALPWQKNIQKTFKLQCPGAEVCRGETLRAASTPCFGACPAAISVGKNRQMGTSESIILYKLLYSELHFPANSWKLLCFNGNACQWHKTL